ncbi:MAG TPA: ATP-binding protein [Myxococcota bacterium]|nr:ATP-binding protein [Myxococcota bacterium]
MSDKTREAPARSLRRLAESKLAGGAAVDIEKLTPDEVRGFVHELEVHRVELELQNLQLAEAQVASEEAKERYRQLYESAPIGYLTLDLEGAITAANAFAADLLSVPLARLLGRKLSSFVAEGHQDRWHLARRALARSSQRRSLELELTLDDGRTLTTQFVSAGSTDRDGTVNLALLDVTELRGVEHALRRAASAASLAEQEERRKLASDLHDDAAQLLSLATLRLRSLADATRGAHDPEFAALLELLAETRGRMTSLIFQLSPPLLHDVGLVAATRWLAEDMERRFGLTVTVIARQEPALDEGTRITLFRAVRELLINVTRHAGVDGARVEISSEGAMARISVEDRGVGFARDADADHGSFGRVLSGRREGFGLLAVRERLGQLGGTLTIGPGPNGAGSRVVASAPLACRKDPGKGGSP